jgi:hypothetical protein
MSMYIYIFFWFSAERNRNSKQPIRPPVFLMKITWFDSGSTQQKVGFARGMHSILIFVQSCGPSEPSSRHHHRDSFYFLGITWQELARFSARYCMPRTRRPKHSDHCCGLSKSLSWFFFFLKGIAWQELPGPFAEHSAAACDFDAWHFVGIYTRPACAGLFPSLVIGTLLNAVSTCFAPVSFCDCLHMSFLDMLKVDSRAHIPFSTAKAQTRSRIAPIVASAPPMAFSAKDANVSPLSLPVCDPTKAIKRKTTPTQLQMVPSYSDMVRQIAFQYVDSKTRIGQCVQWSIYHSLLPRLYQTIDFMRAASSHEQYLARIYTQGNLPQGMWWCKLEAAKLPILQAGSNAGDGRRRLWRLR